MDDTTRAIGRRQAERRPPDEKPYLIGLAGEFKGQPFPLEGLKEVVFGRAPENEFNLTLDDEVSRRHARVDLDDAGRVWLVDLGSTNGTLVNGREIREKTLLRRGDRIYLGESTIFKLDWLSEDEARQFHLAILDGLTEVHNQGFFEARFPELFDLARERDKELSLIEFDLDHFKQLNDTHGHLAGDLALQSVAAALQESADPVGGEALVCRKGGEEFAIVLPGVGLDDARHIAERARMAVAALRIEYHGAVIPVTVSAGVASLPADSANALRDAADKNLYKAKAGGRNRVV